MLRSGGLWTFALLAGLLLAQTAWATAFTVDGPMGVTDGSSTATINQVFDLSGTANCVVGTCDVFADDVLVFSATATIGTFDEIRASYVGLTFLKGVGYFSDPDTTPSGVSSTPAMPFATQGIWDFDAPNLTGTSDRLFITYASGALSTDFDASFMVQAVGDPIFSNTAGLMVVPEPGTMLLLGTGLVGLASWRRRH